MIGLGIDTGGTCTDAVLYDMDHGKVLSVGKTLTTKEKLEDGIQNAVSMLDKDRLKDASFVSVSTTLATNACVENRGGRVKLLFIGVKPDTLEDVYKNYGFESLEDIRFIQGVPEGGFCKAIEPQWDKLYEMADDFADADAIGIVQYFPEWNNGAFEKQAKKILAEKYAVPIICGSALFSDINAIKRGSGTYLNIRLIPIIKKFLCAVKAVLKNIGLNVPVFVVRSDGSLMNEDFTKDHPVETLLCGPAASALGGAWMTNEKDALVVDIGGTTTDIAVLRSGEPVKVESGIKINGWQTFVKGMYINTFGLGGDSAVRFNKNGIYLENFRVIPIAMITAKYPELLKKLELLCGKSRVRKGFIYEGFVLQGCMTDENTYSQSQIELCKKLKDGPVLYEEAEEICGRFNIEECTERLEKENIIMRFGITPTDMMHITGDYTAYNKQASELAIQCLSEISHIAKDDIPGLVYSAFRKKLYCNLVNVLLEMSAKEYRDGVPGSIRDFIEMGYDMDQADWIKLLFKTDLTLIGVGGPAHIFMNDVGEKLGTRVYIHENAKVANAIGTLAGRISVSNSIDLSFCSDNTTDGFRTFIRGEKKIISDFNDAVKEAEHYLKEKTEQTAKERGAKGKITFTVKVDENRVENKMGTYLMGGKVTVAAYANII